MSLKQDKLKNPFVDCVYLRGKGRSDSRVSEMFCISKYFNVERLESIVINREVRNS